jgi:hypothetical protein
LSMLRIDSNGMACISVCSSAPKSEPTWGS